MKAKLVEDLMDEYQRGAVVSNAEMAFNPEDRLEQIIERVKKEYTFNMPNKTIDKKFFKKIEDSTAKARRLYDSLCNAPVGEALHNIDMAFYGVSKRMPRSSVYLDLATLICSN